MESEIQLGWSPVDNASWWLNTSVYIKCGSWLLRYQSQYQCGGTQASVREHKVYIPCIWSGWNPDGVWAKSDERSRKSVLYTFPKRAASVQSPEISAALVQLFYGYIMITLATDIVQQFYTHWQTQDNQAVLIISFKKLFNYFFDEIISNGRKKFLDYGERIRTDVSHTHTAPKVVTTFESFRSEFSKYRFGIRMLWGFCQSLRN